MNANILVMAKESGITAHEPVSDKALADFADRVSGHAFARCCDVLMEMHNRDKERHNYYYHAVVVLKMVWRETPSTDHGSRT
jgi:hypothetical protein